MMCALRLAMAAVLAVVSVARAAPVEVHPAGPTVPENLLRIELRFSQPQAQPFDLGRLQLLDGAGREIQHALLDLALPSVDGRRVTVLMDPGRVKSGVGPNLDAGRALREGSTVSLRISALEAGASPTIKTWRVTAAARGRVRPESWHAKPPRNGTRDALVVDTRTPISSAGEGLITVVDGSGRRVLGTTALSNDDATWTFTPRQPWTSGAYRLVTHPELEDPAGNRSCASFEEIRLSEARCELPHLDFIPSGRRTSRAYDAARS